MLQWMNRTALELIGRSGFNHSFDSLEPDGKEHPVGPAIRETLCVHFYVSQSFFTDKIEPESRGINTGGIALVRQTLQHIFIDWGSPRFQRAVVNILPWPALHRVRDRVDMLHENSTQIFEDAKRAMAAGKDDADHKRVGGGKDILSVLSEWLHV